MRCLRQFCNCNSTIELQAVTEKLYRVGEIKLYVLWQLLQI